MDDALTLQEKQLAILMRVWAVAFALGGLVFFLAPEWLFARMNETGSLFFGRAFEPIPMPSEKFWVSLALSLMATLTFMCYMAQKDIRRGSGYVFSVLVSKIASTTFFLFYYIDGLHSFAYIQGSLLTDGPIFIITFIFYLRAVRSRREES